MMKTWLILVAVLSVLPLRAEVLDKEELLNHVKEPTGDLHDWAKQNAIDLPQLVDGCLDHDDRRRQFRSWQLFVWWLANCGADGAAGDELCMVGPSVARHTDTERLCEIIGSIPESHLVHLPFSLRWRLDYANLSDEEKRRLQELHPAVVRAIAGEVLREVNYSEWAKAQREQSDADEGSAPSSAVEESVLESE